MIWWIEHINLMIFACWLWWSKILDWYSIYSAPLTSKFWGTNAVVLGQSFWEKFSLCKNDPKMELLSYFEKFCHSFLQKAYLNKIWYCLEFDMMGRDFRFITRFWISMTELFVIMNSFMITERKKIDGFINGSVTFK